MIKIILADDHTIVREGLKQILLVAGELTIVGEASDGHEVMRLIRETACDVLLLDMSMPGKNGVELIKQVKNEKPKIRVLVLSMHEEQHYAARTIKAGASGYLSKESASAQLISAIHKVAGGGIFISASVAEYIALSSLLETPALPHTLLSNREYQVFHLLVSGYSVSDIAGQLHVSIKTVSTHKTRLMQKMNLVNHTEMIRYALEHNLIDAFNTSSGLSAL